MKHGSTEMITRVRNAMTPCPMCPTHVRNLAATVHNLAWRLESYTQYANSPCKVVEKFQSMSRAVESVSLGDDVPDELRQLWQAAKNASACETVAELITHAPKLKAASEAVKPLSDAHFADELHSHSKEMAVFRDEVPCVGKPC